MKGQQLFRLSRNSDGSYSGQTPCISCGKALVFKNSAFPQESDMCSACIVAADAPMAWLAVFGG